MANKALRAQEELEVTHDRDSHARAHIVATAVGAHKHEDMRDRRRQSEHEAPPPRRRVSKHEASGSVPDATGVILWKTTKERDDGLLSCLAGIQGKGQLVWGEAHAFDTQQRSGDRNGATSRAAATSGQHDVARTAASCKASCYNNAADVP